MHRLREGRVAIVTGGARGLGQRRALRLLIGLIAWAIATTSVSASDPSNDAEWTLAPYAWALNFSGRVGIGGQSVPLDVDAEELVGSIKAGAMGYARRVQGPHMLYAEGLGFDFEDRSLEQFNDLPTRAQALFVELGYGYRFEQASALPNGGIITLTPYVGLRHASLDIAADVPFPFADVAADEQWLDPVLGLLVEGPIRGRLAYVLKLDGAGFGLGQDHYSSGALYAVYRFEKSWMLGGGYRISRFNADPGGDNDLTLRLLGRGPALGLGYRW